jgi:serine/threonine protein kinase
MSLDKPLDLEFIGKGTYGIIMKKKTQNNHYYIIKQFRVEIYDDGTTSLEREANFAKKAYNMNDDIFINIINNYTSDINLAKQINIKVPFINCISINNFAYIHMEYMSCGDLYEYIKTYKYFDLTGILGCYFNGLNILHNELNIIHGDITPNNILVNYIGPDYRQKIIINNNIHYIDTKGYCFKIADFGLAEYLYNTKNNNSYISHIYRDYLLLYYLFFYNNKFYNYRKFCDLIEIPLGQINDDFFIGYSKTDKYKQNFVEDFSYRSVCNFMNKFLEINNDSKLIFDLPKILLQDFIDIIC